MDKLKSLFQRIDGMRNDMIDLQVRLGSVPAVSPENGGRGEAAKAEILSAFLEETGPDEGGLIKAPDINADAGYRPNLTALVKGEETGSNTWIVTHMDVVPPGELALWDGDPFKPWVEHGRIYGRGMEDNQQDMVASLFALKALREENIQPRFGAGVVLVADEETGSEKGIKYVLRNKNPFRPDDLIVVPDTGNSSGTKIDVAEKSILWLTIRTIGKQAHGSAPNKGINSLRAASRLIVDLADLYDRFSKTDTLFDPPMSTFEPTKKEPNVPNINTIPGEDVFHMDMRILPAYSVEEVEQAVREHVARIEESTGVRIETETVRREPAAPATRTDAPIVLALQNAVKTVFEVTARPMGIGGGTGAAFLRRAGYQAACWSKSDETAHQPNEYCVIDNMVGTAKVFAHLFLRG